MLWQDIVPLVGNLVSTVALIPSVLSSSKPHKATCALTAGILLTYVATFLSLGLVVWSIATLPNALGWLVLLFQRR